MKLSPLERILLGVTAVFVLGTALICCFGNRSASVVVMSEGAVFDTVLPVDTQETSGYAEKPSEAMEPSVEEAAADLSQVARAAQPSASSFEPSKEKLPEVQTGDVSPEISEAETITQQKVNLNTATLNQLIELPGIGEKRAEDILAYRMEHGSFSKIEDVMKVSGIGRGIFSEIKPYLTVE